MSIAKDEAYKEAFVLKIKAKLVHVCECIIPTSCCNKVTWFITWLLLHYRKESHYIQQYYPIPAYLKAQLQQIQK